jgi:hypothetical protein
VAGELKVPASASTPGEVSGMLSALEIRAVLVEMLAGAVGGEPTRWHEVIGDIEVLSWTTHPVCSWAVVPQGTEAENSAVYLAAEVVRQEHPPRGHNY